MMPEDNQLAFREASLGAFSPPLVEPLPSSSCLLLLQHRLSPSASVQLILGRRGRRRRRRRRKGDDFDPPHSFTKSNCLSIAESLET
jgi:hypothetical protein